MLKFNSKANSVIGVDINSTSVRLLQLTHKGDRYQVESYGSLPLTENAVVDKNIVDSELVADVLERVYNLANPSSKQVAIAVPTAAVITKLVEMDLDMNDDERELQIRMEAEQYIPFPLDEVSLDFELVQVNPRNPGRGDILVVATRSENVERRAEVVELAGLKPKVVDVDSFAMERAYHLLVDSLPLGVKVVGILDIGHHQSTLNILDKGQTIYSREQNFGGKQLTQEIQQRYGLSQEDAAIAKIERNLPDDYDTEILYPFMDALAQQTARSLQLFFSSSPYNEIDHLLLAGGGANIQGLAKVLQDLLGCRVTVANPFLHMSFASQVNVKKLESEASSLLIACGLALRSFEQ